ncbi:MAG TPA: diacylglycerol kinase family lipid kinase [Candidatus Dorea faecigallinarum]|nr:diacylglycerol kinase family lipid kinase [Candidatus Dorea faecigallinarum]
MYHFIVNPAARSGLGKETWRELRPLLDQKELPYQVHFTRYQTHATKIAKEITSDGARHTLIVLGGDGTVNEVLNGICHLSQTELGYIPLGSGNDLARGLGLPADPKEALEKILTAPVRPVDIGCIRYNGQSRRFIVSAGLGFDAAVCHQVMVSKLKAIFNLLHLGKLTYAGVALQLLFFLRSGKMTILLDGRKKLALSNVYFAAAMNLPFEGGGFRFCPKADCEDGTLNIIAVAGLPKLVLLLLLPTAFFGLHTHFPGIYTLTCKNAEFISQEELPVHTDGEPVLRQKRIKVCLEKEKLLMKFINKQ